jgi:hypothetical protein
MTNVFEHPEQKFIDEIRGELRDYWDNVDYSSKVISFGGKTWLIKSKPDDPELKNRELLAFLLGGSWLNIPEVRLLSSEEFQALSKKTLELGDNASEQNTYLVRLVQDYGISELPVQSFDSAVASEIAFSAWILRRDAHAANRAFVRGIPMFFDFHIAFGFEVGDFFKEGPDGGYVGNWRLWQIKNSSILSDIALLRRLEFDKKIAAIPIINKSHFEASLFRATEYIKNLDGNYLYETIEKAGFSEERGSLLSDILQRSSANLDANIGKVLSIINDNNIDIFSEDYLIDELIKYYSRYKSVEFRAECLSRDLETANLRISELSDALDDIHESVVWQVLMGYHCSFIEKVLPAGSELRKSYDRAIRISRRLMKKEN